MALLGSIRIMAKKLACALADIRNEFDTVLEIGAGTGLLTRELAARIKFKNYIANDLSEKSRQYLNEILPAYTFLPGNACEISAEADLIVSNACLQWIEDWNCLPYAPMLAFTTFLPGNLSEITDLTGLSLNYKTTDEIKNTFDKILYWEEFEHELNFSSPQELLAHLKHTGVNSLAKWSFAQVKDFCRRCKTPRLTYRPLVIIADLS